MDKYKVLEFKTVDDFRKALKAEFMCGWCLHSWNIDDTWGIVAVFARRFGTWEELWRD